MYRTATAEEAPAEDSLSDSGGGGGGVILLYPPPDGRAAEQHLPQHAARRRPAILLCIYIYVWGERESRITHGHLPSPAAKGPLAYIAIVLFNWFPFSG